ncbi:hypothetical protein [Actinacidiphila sp. bgisy160]
MEGIADLGGTPGWGERPAGTEHLTEEELVPLVTRDAGVGVAKVAAP